MKQPSLNYQNEIKQDLYKDFMGYVPDMTLCLYIPNEESGDKFWYDNSIIIYKNGDFILRETPAARWWVTNK